MRTTLNIDAPILDELKKIQNEQGVPLGRLVTQLLSEALLGRNRESIESPHLDWISKPMKARVDLRDRDAVYAILDENEVS